jgi:hypothetical protein
MLENRMLRDILGPNSDKLRGGWKKLHVEKLHDFYSGDRIMKN